MRLVLATLGLIGPFSQFHRELAGEDGRHQEDEKGNPFFYSVDREDIERRHKKVIKGEKGYQRGKDRGIAASYACQRQHHKQIDNRNVGDARIQMKKVDDGSDQHRSNESQHAIKQIALPGKPVLDGQHTFYSAHIYKPLLRLLLVRDSRCSQARPLNDQDGLIKKSPEK